MGVGEALHLTSRHKIHPISLFLFPPILWLKNVAKICNNIEKLVELKEKFQNISQNISQKRTKFFQKKKTGDLGLLLSCIARDVARSVVGMNADG